MTSLPVFAPGATVTVEERHHGLLWSAVPHRVIESDPDLLVSWVPAGTVSMRAGNRGMPGTEGLTREQRKLLALRTREAWALELREAPSMLFLHRAGRWSRINLGWNEAGEFLGWYVNIERPAVPTDSGVSSKDLVLDLWVNPDRSWSWKDREDYEYALEEQILDADIRTPIEAEVTRVLDELARAEGPFSDAWPAFRPDPAWPVPVLPAGHGWGGELWTLPMGSRVAG